MQCCGEGPNLSGSGSCGRLRLSNFNIKYSLKNKVKYFYFFKCVRNLPIISTTLCKSCYNLTKIIRIVAPLPPQNPRSQCILTSSGSSKQVRLRLHNNESTIKQKNISWDVTRNLPVPGSCNGKASQGSGCRRPPYPTSPDVLSRAAGPCCTQWTRSWCQRRNSLNHNMQYNCKQRNTLYVRQL